MRRAWPVVLGMVLLIVFGLRVPDATPTNDDSTGIPDDRIGLVHQDIEAIPIPDEVHDNMSAPGERSLPSRWNELAPPVIPHGIDDFLPVTKSSNACLECHGIEEKVEGEPTPVPESHYRDLRNAPTIVREQIAGSRYVCISCHAAQTDARPLPVSDREP